MPSGVHSYRYMSNIERALRSQLDRVNVEPVIYTFQSTVPAVKETNCVSNGAYCAFPHPGSPEANGRTVLLEALAQLCILDLGIDTFGDYLARFQECQPLFSQTCSTKIAADMGLDQPAIQTCVNATFEGNTPNLYDSGNTKLAQHRKRSKQLGTTSFPAIFINDVLYRGSSAYKDIYLTLCTALSGNPKKCTEVELEDTGLEITATQAAIWTGVFFIIGLLFLCVICRAIAKRRYLKLGYKVVE